MTDRHMLTGSSFSSESVQTLFCAGHLKICSKDETIVLCDNGMSCALIEVS